jgi:HK97 gp10 family phage protein
MPLPKSVVKIKKDGIEFTSNVDRVQYTLQELTRAALRDAAKLIRKRMITKLKTLPGMRRSKRLYNSTQYWVRKRECDLQIGFKHDTWYGVLQELGTKNQPARHILRSTVFENIDEIRRIEGTYLSAIEDENKALGLIDEDGNPYYPEEGEDE